MKKTKPTLTLLCALCLVATGAWAQSNRPYTPVTDARLLKQEPQNWLTYHGNYAGWNFSELSKINAGNVNKLTLAWAFTTGMQEGHQAPPFVNNGYMFITTPQSQVIALDAKTGQEIWRYKKELPAEQLMLHPTSRGPALYGDKLYLATQDCMLVALDAKTGKVLWTTVMDNWKNGYYTSLAPLAVKGKIITGTSGGELGVRGWVAAVDAETGKIAWKTHTIPAPGEPGGDTWPDNGSYKTGGGGVWQQPTYDPETNTIFVGVGNPGPWTPDQRMGDNLYTSSTMAIDPDTGKIKGHFQYTPHESWDWDEIVSPLLMDIDYKGKKVKAAVHAARNGYLYILDRTGGKLSFVDAFPFVYQDVFTGIDKKTGRPSINEAKRPSMSKKNGTDYCPSLWGGHNWPPESYNPHTQTYYVPANDHICSHLPPNEQPVYKPGELFIGLPIPELLANIRVPKPGEGLGEVQAWDMKTGKLTWKHKYQTFQWGPLMSTAGNLVFGGGTNDRMFRAFDARNGKLLWETPTPSGVTATPSTYEVDGEQYVAVQSGWGIDAERMQGSFNTVMKTNVKVPQGGTLMVYKLKP
jgi:alcohol dehydrogenase (cytochrome c)